MEIKHYAEFEKDYLIIGSPGILVDSITGEIFFEIIEASQEDLKSIRNKVAWKTSLRHDAEIFGENVALENLLSLYQVCYWDYPDFIPGFAIRKSRKDQLHGWG